MKADPEFTFQELVWLYCFECGRVEEHGVGDRLHLEFREANCETEFHRFDAEEQRLFGFEVCEYLFSRYTLVMLHVDERDIIEAEFAGGEHAREEAERFIGQVQHVFIIHCN